MAEKIKFDTHNYRNHDERNLKLIEKSLKECGAGRSIVADADGVIIGGNATYKTAQKLNIPTKVIETDGNTLVILKRTDLKNNSKKRKKLALLDNSTSNKVIWDLDNVSADFDLAELPDMGLEEICGVDIDGLNDLSDKIEPHFEVAVDCLNEEEQQKLFNKLIAEGYKCRILTL